MQLSDRDIRRMLSNGRLDIKPQPYDRQFQPATVDLTLGEVLGKRGLPYLLEPNEFALGSTIETITMPSDLAAIVKGKSSWARRGLLVECAGFIDPGFHGQITLELKNLHHEDELILRYEDTIAQIAFYRLDSRCDRQYGDPGLGSHYQHQQGATLSAHDPKAV